VNIFTKTEVALGRGEYVERDNGEIVAKQANTQGTTVTIQHVCTLVAPQLVGSAIYTSRLLQSQPVAARVLSTHRVQRKAIHLLAGSLLRVGRQVRPQALKRE
jgi:hypothetical protein